MPIAGQTRRDVQVTVQPVGICGCTAFVVNRKQNAPTVQTRIITHNRMIDILSGFHRRGDYLLIPIKFLVGQRDALPGLTEHGFIFLLRCLCDIFPPWKETIAVVSLLAAVANEWRFEQFGATFCRLGETVLLRFGAVFKIFCKRANCDKQMIPGA